MSPKTPVQKTNSILGNDVRTCYPNNFTTHQDTRDQEILNTQVKSLVNLMRLKAIASDQFPRLSVDETLPAIVKDELLKKNQEKIDQYRREGTEEAMDLLKYVDSEEEDLQETLRLLQSQINTVKKELRLISKEREYAKKTTDFLPLAKLFTSQEAFDKATRQFVDQRF